MVLVLWDVFLDEVFTDELAKGVDTTETLSESAVLVLWDDFFDETLTDEELAEDVDSNDSLAESVVFVLWADFSDESSAKELAEAVDKTETPVSVAVTEAFEDLTEEERVDEVDLPDLATLVLVSSCCDTWEPPAAEAFVLLWLTLVDDDFTELVPSLTDFVPLPEALVVDCFVGSTEKLVLSAGMSLLVVVCAEIAEERLKVASKFEDWTLVDVPDASPKLVVGSFSSDKELDRVPSELLTVSLLSKAELEKVDNKLSEEDKDPGNWVDCNEVTEVDEITLVWVDSISESVGSVEREIVDSIERVVCVSNSEELKISDESWLTLAEGVSLSCDFSFLDRDGWGGGFSVLIEERDWGVWDVGWAVEDPVGDVWSPWEEKKETSWDESDATTEEVDPGPVETRFVSSCWRCEVCKDSVVAIVVGIDETKKGG